MSIYEVPTENWLQKSHNPNHKLLLSELVFGDEVVKRVPWPHDYTYWFSVQNYSGLSFNVLQNIQRYRRMEPKKRTKEDIIQALFDWDVNTKNKTPMVQQDSHLADNIFTNPVKVNSMYTLYLHQKSLQNKGNPLDRAHFYGYLAHYYKNQLKDGKSKITENWLCNKICHDEPVAPWHLDNHIKQNIETTNDIITIYGEELQKELINAFKETK